ncbi:peptidase inhibitor family I36 protein [Streptomyces sp. NPDC058653]|uniref:peptidase inhibitor family I36 protein n=1 Tax=Streptomyces sp. NPDC058653 TaxID=3346576 RepID=UPI003657F796
MPISTGKRLGIGIATLALASTAFGATGTAQAAPSDCPRGWFCVWSGQNYTGRMQKVQGDNTDLSQFTVFADGALSGFNNGISCDVNVYAGKNYTRFIDTVERGYKGSDASPDKFLSNKWVNCS